MSADPDNAIVIRPAPRNVGYLTASRALRRELEVPGEQRADFLPRSGLRFCAAH